MPACTPRDMAAFLSPPEPTPCLCRRMDMSCSCTRPSAYSYRAPAEKLTPKQESALRDRILALLSSQKQMVSRDWLIQQIKKL